MKNIRRHVMMLATFAAVACVEENLEPNHHPVAEGEAINFCVGKPETRTIYESTDSKQILWNNGDEIRVFYAFGAGDADLSVISSDYVVTRLTSDGSDADTTIGDEGTIAAKTADNQLTWQEAETHKFYATWPANNNITVSKNGIATFPINRDQKCYIQTDEEKSADSDATKYTYVARPDMANAYMVATSESAPESNKIWLTFKPIMTTLNIVVKGPQNLTSEGKPDDNTTASPIVVTGVSIISTIQTNTTESKAVFNYDINNGKITGSASGSGNMTEQTETTFISIVNTDGLNAITLNQGETLCLTAFLPPMAEETAVALQRDIKIRVHTTGGNKTMTLAEASALTPSAKGNIKLPSVYTPISGSNWITPLDDNIYVAQLSIPGTHDSATKYCTDALGVGASNSGQCQQYTISEQLEMGIRFFDLRPTANNLEIYHGSYACYKDKEYNTKLTLNDVWTDFNTFLDENPGEFIIAILRWEKERVINNNEDDFNANMNTFAASDTYMQKALSLDKVRYDVTVGEMRGKILSIMRPNQGTSPDGYFNTTAPIGMTFISGFPGSHATGTLQAYCKPKYVDYGSDQWGSRTNWIVYCQNYYEVCEIKEGALWWEEVIKTEEQAVADKLASVKTFIQHATTQANDGTNVWVINHCSGYLGTSAIFDAYADLSNRINKPTYEYIQNMAVPGCLGTIMLDFVGTRSFDGIEVYGDLLPQIIIDNNYKYRMKRKGE